MSKNVEDHRKTVLHLKMVFEVLILLHKASYRNVGFWAWGWGLVRGWSCLPESGTSSVHSFASSYAYPLLFAALGREGRDGNPRVKGLISSSLAA